MSKRVSVITVNYRSWDALEGCLHSFQEFPQTINMEIIVVDNDSKDERINMFKTEFPHVKFVSNSGNYGFSSGCNLGAKHANGDYLLFLNPDTLITESKTIEKMLNFLEKHPDVGITSCRRVNQKGKIEREISFLNPWLTIGWIRAIYKAFHKSALKKQFSDRLCVCYPEWVSGSVVFISRALFDAVDGWSEDDYWMYFEDPDLCLKCKFINKKTALLRTTKIIHAHGGASRRNPVSTAITKSEVVNSCHVYINKHTHGLNKLILHFTITLNTLISQCLKLIFSAIFFWKRYFFVNLYVLGATLYFYAHSVKNRTWKSRRLKDNES